MTEEARSHQERLNGLTIEEREYLLKHIYRVKKIIELVSVQDEAGLTFFFTSARADCEDAFRLLFKAAGIKDYSFKSESGPYDRYGDMVISFKKPADCVFIFRILEGNI